MPIMEKVQNNGITTKLFIKEISSTGSKLATVNLNLMEICTREISLTVNSTEKVNTTLPKQAKYTKEISTRIRFMEAA